MKYLLFILSLTVLLTPKKTNAQPDFNTARKAAGITFFQDQKQKEVYYYLPGNLAIGQTEGKPDLSFILMRYAGSATYNDEEKTPHFRNILTMRLVMTPQNPDSLRAARKQLQQPAASTHTLAPVQLKPVPISQIEAMVVFTPVGGSDTASMTAKGEMAAESNAGYTTTATYWQERYFTLFLDNNSAQLLLQAFDKNLTVISFMYAFYAKGLTDKKALDISGYGHLDNSFQKQLTAALASDAPGNSSTPGSSTGPTDSAGPSSPDNLHECIVKSDAFPINIDTAKNPNIIHKIDINDAMPPGYAVLNVRNYDFANHLRNDLYEKTVELEATAAAGGDPVNLSVTFSIRSTDITSINFRFKYAVRLDKPYRYRIHELMLDGQETVSDWKTISVWSNLLDVTTRPPVDTQ